MEIKIKKITEDAVIPTAATSGSGAYDLYCPIMVMIPANKRAIIPLKFAMEIPKGYVADIRPRSGYSANGFVGRNNGRHDCDVLLGTIDSDYRGEIGVILKNSSDRAFIIDKGQRIAQMLIHKAEQVTFNEVDNLTETARGDGGFGHSGN